MKKELDFIIMTRIDLKLLDVLEWPEFDKKWIQWDMRYDIFYEAQAHTRYFKKNEEWYMIYMIFLFTWLLVKI